MDRVSPHVPTCPQTEIVCASPDCSVRVTLDCHTQYSSHELYFSQAGYDPLAYFVCEASVWECHLAFPEVHSKLSALDDLRMAWQRVLKLNILAGFPAVWADPFLAAELGVTCSSCVSESRLAHLPLEATGEVFSFEDAGPASREASPSPHPSELPQVGAASQPGTSINTQVTRARTHGQRRGSTY